MYTRRLNFRMFADEKQKADKKEDDNKIPPYKPKTQTSYDKMDDWEYRSFDKNPGGKWERVVESKNPNTYRIKIKDLPANTPSKKDDKKDDKKVIEDKSVDESKEQAKRFRRREKYRGLTETAQTEFDKYYGKTDEKEKQKIEKDAAKQISDYIQKVSEGESSAEFPDLPSDMKVKFITAMFLLLRSKQLDEIKAPNKVVQKQKDMVVAKIESKAIDALKTVTDHISTKGMIERHISPPKDPESIFKKSGIKKSPSGMSDDEFSDMLAGRNEENPIDFALRRKDTRDKTFKDLPPEHRKNAEDVSEVIKDYKKNFGKFNDEIGNAVKVKTQDSKVGFVMEGYKPSGSDIVSNVTLPVENIPYNKISTSLNDIIKKLTANGFKGKIEIETDPEKLLMNKGNIRVVSDNVKHTQAASEMLKEAFSNNGINSSIEMEKKQFGMNQPEQIKYMTNLKRLALNSTENGELNLPPEEIEKYMIAARLRGYDLVPSGKLYGLRPHAPDSPIGQIKLSNSSDPEEFKKSLFEADLKEKKGQNEEQAPDIKIDNPFGKIKKTMDEYLVEHPEEEDEFDYEELGEGRDNRKKRNNRKNREDNQEDEYSDERMDRIDGMFDRRDSDIPDDETVGGRNTFDVDSYLKDTDTSEKSIKEKIKNNDDSVFQDVSDLIEKNIHVMDDNTLARAYGDSVIKRMKDIFFDLGTSKLDIPEDMQGKIDNLTEKIRTSQTPVPKKEDEFDFSKIDGYEKNETPVKLFDWVKSAQVKNDDNYPTGWIMIKDKDKNFDDRYKLTSLDGKHSIWGDKKNGQGLKDFAKENPYQVAGAKTWLDPVDYDEQEINDGGEDIKQGRVLLSNKDVDTSGTSKIGESYGIDKDSPVTKELYGFKRLIFKGLSDSDRKEIKEKGLINYLSNKPSMKTMVSDFVQRMNPENYSGTDFNDIKKKVADIAPVDFVKMIAGIKAKKT